MDSPVVREFYQNLHEKRNFDGCSESQIFFMASKCMEDIISFKDAEAINLYFTCEKEDWGYVVYRIYEKMNIALDAVQISKRMGIEYVLPLVIALEKLKFPVFYFLWKENILGELKDYSPQLTPLDLVFVINHGYNRNRDDDIKFLEEQFTKSLVISQVESITWENEELLLWERNGYKL